MAIKPCIASLLNEAVNFISFRDNHRSLRRWVYHSDYVDVISFLHRRHANRAASWASAAYWSRYWIMLSQMKLHACRLLAIEWCEIKARKCHSLRINHRGVSITFKEIVGDGIWIDVIVPTSQEENKPRLTIMRHIAVHSARIINSFSIFMKPHRL